MWGKVLVVGVFFFVLAFFKACLFVVAALDVVFFEKEKENDEIEN